MNTTRATVTLSALALAAGLLATTTAGASAATADEQLNPAQDPLVSQEASGYRGTWAVSGGSLQEAFEQDGVVISTGTTGLRSGLDAEQVVSFGYVAGFGDPVSGVDHSQLSGQAGADVTAVRVVSASGVTTTADLADGVWGAVWVSGSDADEHGRATIEYDTPTGTRTVSTDAVDVIAADQRAAEQG
ncbi:hypothetical protein [Curtobacterium sp. MCBD17_021]|uniref:hypothetical protein n=1 Tax=Curtobacterium sp. MCBD17_021 TaxID=2175665 RepID=UPI000DAAD402|nr:hypothetical protein [Curtobacterium sp. MCBD17_021]PZE61845.1 hypothetical protein DEI83_15485 [Curtobacterium sp. MCBD17_021]